MAYMRQMDVRAGRHHNVLVSTLQHALPLTLNIQYDVDHLYARFTASN